MTKKLIKPTSKFFKKKTRATGFTRKTRHLPRGSKIKTIKLPPITIGRDKFGRWAKRKKR